MAMKTQGTELYTIDPDSGELLKVGCVTGIDGIDTTLDQLENTCLEDMARTYEAGLATPGTATFTINTDTRDPSHVRLHQLKVAGVVLDWAIGWSDNRDLAPTVLDGEFDLQETRSWLVFRGYMTAFPFSFQQNAFVTSNVGIQVSGEPQLIPAVTP